MLPNGDPINLVVAVVVAVVGGCLALFVIVRWVLEVRQRRALREQGPELAGLDDDIQRYLTRVFLMVAAWKPRLGVDGSADLDRLWVEAETRARALQENRAVQAEGSRDIAELVALEKRIDEQIDAARSGPANS